MRRKYYLFKQLRKIIETIASVRYGIPQSPDYPSSCFPRMVSQLKWLLQTPVSSVELFSKLMHKKIAHMLQHGSDPVSYLLA